MDPQAAWDALIAAYRSRDPERVEEHALALKGWLEKGGFPPYVGGAYRGDDWHRALAEAGIAFALDYVDECRRHSDDA
jgi:hypothetical protein